MESPPPPAPRARGGPLRGGSLRRLGLRIVWLVCAVLLALGAAGIIAGIDHQPGTAARAELTWAADRAIEPGLVAAASDLDHLSGEVDGLSSFGRVALAALVTGDLDSLNASIANGKTLIGTIEKDTAALRARLAALPGSGPDAETRLSGQALQRYAGLSLALDATAGLRDSWNQLTAGTVAAIKLSTLLSTHDRQTATAARTGTRGEYATALAQLDEADATIAQSRELRDQLANTVDVSVLTTWIDLNAAYDKALRDLYSALRKSNGKATAAVKAASKAEQQAREQLPPDTKALVVIMGEVARGGLNQAVITIEEARKRLSDASDALSAPPSPTPSSP
jgi:hypothetical protein